MKTLLCCAFLWVLPYGQLCEPVWAEVSFFTPKPCPPTCNPEAPEDFTVTTSPDPCLAQLEAAMRAMEPFLPDAYVLKNDEYWYDHHRYKGDIDDIANAWVKARGTMQQWDAAKTACWKEPK